MTVAWYAMPHVACLFAITWSSRPYSAAAFGACSCSVHFVFSTTVKAATSFTCGDSSLVQVIDVLPFLVLVIPEVWLWNQNEWIPIKKEKKKDVDSSQADLGAVSHHFSQHCFASGKRLCEAFHHWSAEERQFSSLPGPQLPCCLLIIA